MQQIVSTPVTWLLAFMQLPRSPDPERQAQQITAQLYTHPQILEASIWHYDEADPQAHMLAGHAPDTRAFRSLITQAIMRNQAAEQPDPRGEQAATLYVLPLRDGSQAFGALALTADPAADAAVWPAAAAYSATLMRLALALQPANAQHTEWDDFISHAVHEIKNPLASTKGYADLLLRRASKESNEAYRKGLAVISQQVSKATGLLEQLSDTSRVTTDRMRIEPRPADLAELVRRVAQAQQIKAEHHIIQLVGADEPLPGVFDEARVSQIIEAMLGNAVRFSPNGGSVTVRLERRDGPSGAPEGVVSVQDAGIGVAPDEQEYVFGRFKRGTNVQGMFSGLGLGLFVARDLAQRHGGRMWLESAPEQGTTCFFALPLE